MDITPIVSLGQDAVRSNVRTLEPVGLPAPWFLCDDSRVTPLPEPEPDSDEFEHKDAYILLYQRETPETRAAALPLLPLRHLGQLPRRRAAPRRWPWTQTLRRPATPSSAGWPGSAAHSVRTPGGSA